MRRSALLLLLLSSCTDPGYDVARVRIPDDLPRARVLIPDGGRPLMIVDDRLAGNCYALAIKHEERHIADPGWVHNREPFVCRQTLPTIYDFAGNAVPNPMPSRSKSGTSQWFPAPCDPPVNGGPETAYCRSRK